MKTYSIDTPAKLEKASDMVKWGNDRKRVLDLLKQWKVGAIAPTITLEMSRNAHLFTQQDGRKSLLATIYVAGARELVKELSEV